MPASPNKPCLLVVEDGPAERDALVRFLRLEGFEVLAAAGPTEALTFLSRPIDLVLSDLRMGDQTGIELLRDWKKQRTETPFILMTAFGAVDSAVQAMKLGAADFLSKPVDPKQLLELIQSVLHRPSAPSAPSAPPPAGFENIIGQSRAILDIRDQTLRAARSKSTVLILGESGTGKELIAEALHRNSPCSQGPLVVINMAAIPDSLVESELFGHLKGAFTGALQPRVGKIQAADGGTLFIDEIGDYPLHLQPKLLRVLENHLVTPVGSNESFPVDVRVIAATSRPLVKMKDEGKFREDLFYRLNVVVLQLPPLRERPDDIPLLTQFFLDQFHRRTKQGPWKVERGLMEELQKLPWPGNIRQLRNCLESMCVLARTSVLSLLDLPADVRPSNIATATTEPYRLESIKRSAILQALQQFNGNRTKTAEFLGISVRTLQRKLREWDATAPE